MTATVATVGPLPDGRTVTINAGDEGLAWINSVPGLPVADACSELASVFAPLRDAIRQERAVEYAAANLEAQPRLLGELTAPVVEGLRRRLECMRAARPAMPPVVLNRIEVSAPSGAAGPRTMRVIRDQRGQLAGVVTE